MKYEISCGCLVIKDNLVLLIKSVYGHWTFPKGHVENDESEYVTAIRETKEETNIDVEISGKFRTVITYQPHPLVTKNVVFFHATALNDDIKIQIGEVEEAGWYAFEDALKLITFYNEQRVLLLYLAKHHFAFDTQAKRANSGSVKWDAYPKMLPFWVADSDYPCFDSLTNVVVKKAKQGVFGYPVILDSVYQAIKYWYDINHHIKLENTNIRLSTGVVTSISQILQYLKSINWSKKQTVVIQSPVYHAFHKVIKAVGYNSVKNPLSLPNYDIDFRHLESLFSQGHNILLLCSPHNPTGKMYDKATLKRLMDLVIKYQVFLISDEIHSDIIINEYRFTSILHVLQETTTNIYPYVFVCNAPSKTFNIAGLNIAYSLTLDCTLRNRFESFCELKLFEKPNIFGQVALVTSYQEGYLWMRSQNAYLYENYLFVKNFFADHLPDAIINDLQATYLLWVDLRAYGDSASIKKRLEDAKVVLSAGEMFDSKFSGFVRINLAAPIGQLRKLVNQLLKYF